MSVTFDVLGVDATNFVMSRDAFRAGFDPANMASEGNASQYRRGHTHCKISLRRGGKGAVEICDELSRSVLDGNPVPPALAFVQP